MSPPQYSKAVPPPQQPPMGVPLHQQPRGAIEGPWSTGLCGCFEDIPNCCVTCWCPCITFGKVSHIVDQGTTSCATNGALYAALACLTGCGCLFSCLYRTKMRKTFGLQKSPCNDCCVHFCCDECALCQEYRELKNRGFDMSIGWEGNMQKQNNGGGAMVSPAPMFQGGMTR